MVEVLLKMNMKMNELLLLQLLLDGRLGLLLLVKLKLVKSMTTRSIVMKTNPQKPSLLIP